MEILSTHEQIQRKYIEGTTGRRQALEKQIQDNAQKADPLNEIRFVLQAIIDKLTGLDKYVRLMNLTPADRKIYDGKAAEVVNAVAAAGAANMDMETEVESEREHDRETMHSIMAAATHRLAKKFTIKTNEKISNDYSQTEKPTAHPSTDNQADI